MRIEKKSCLKYGLESDPETVEWWNRQNNKAKYEVFDAEKKCVLPESVGVEHRQCDCGSILRGLKKPLDCKLFATVCTPQNPLGACMVSSEGACAAVYAYGRMS